MTSVNWPVIGHAGAVLSLDRAVSADRPAHAYLISGPPQIGKTTLARSLALALDCQSANAARPCGQCRSCRLIAAGKHPDVQLIEPDGARVKIDQVRALQHDLSLRPVEGRYRVAIFDQFELATTEAQNALLKTLEEPPDYVVLVVLAPDPELLLPTIVSRCQQVPLRPLTIMQVREALIKHWNVEANQANLLAHLSGGRLGWAVGAAGDSSIMSARAKYLDDLQSLLKADRVARFAYAGGPDEEKRPRPRRDRSVAHLVARRAAGEQRQFSGFDQRRSRGADSGIGATRGLESSQDRRGCVWPCPVANGSERHGAVSGGSAAAGFSRGA